jgi:Zn finger protein HypA/HybF involved in hydrogenase expression
MTRDERIQNIVRAMNEKLSQRDWPERHPLKSAADHVLEILAEVALDVVDSTREPCECRQCHLDSLVADKPALRTKANFDAAFGPGKCLHRYGKNMLPAEDGRFRCPDCGETFDVPPTAEDIERLIAG